MKDKLLTLVLLGAIAAAGVASRSSAQTLVHRDHFLTFATPIVLPNGQVLPAGKYLFRLGPGLQSTVRQDITQILSADGLTVVGMLFTMPVQRSATDGFEVTLVQTPPDRLPLLKAWFCDRNGRTGHAFVATPMM